MIILQGNVQLGQTGRETEQIQQMFNMGEDQMDITDFNNEHRSR